MLRAAVFVLAASAAACAGKAPVRPAAPVVTPAMRFDHARELLRSGCYECLLEAFTEYENLLGDGTVGTQAGDALIRAGFLIALRERDLGLNDTGHYERAKQRAGFAATDLSGFLDVAETFISRDQLAYTRVARNRVEWSALFRSALPDDDVSTILWLKMACGPYSKDVAGAEDRVAVLGQSIDRPLIAFEHASCFPRQGARLTALLERNPRFFEISFILGQVALSGISPTGGFVAPDLEGADARFREAYAWRQDWPLLTLSIANVAMTAEDFARALDFYDKTLGLVPVHPEALLGKVRTLVYLGKYVEAVSAADELLTTNRTPGEARYWRAYAESRLGRDDDAWTDVELAAKTLINADVPKLAGIIAINRRQLDVARERLEESHRRRLTDCETTYFLQAVLSEQRDWPGAAQMASDASACFDTEIADYTGEIERYRTADMPEVRRARQIAKRESQIAVDIRMRATSWFNGAAAYFNIASHADARRLAEKLLDDSQFAARARALIDRLPRP